MTATTAASQDICLGTAQRRERNARPEAAGVAAAVYAITATRRVICQGIVRIKWTVERVAVTIASVITAARVDICRETVHRNSSHAHEADRSATSKRHTGVL